MSKHISMIWAQSDSNAQPSDLESDALPLRHRPENLAPTHNSYGDQYGDAVIPRVYNMVYIVCAIVYYSMSGGAIYCAAQLV